MDRARPLAATPAADLDDARLLALSVDPGAALRTTLLAPADPVPRLLLGVRGSGKTHALRLWSWPVAGLREPAADALDLVRADGLLAVHFRLNAFDAQRYRPRGRAGAAWLTAFARQLEWRLAERLLDVLGQWRARSGDAGFDNGAWAAVSAHGLAGAPDADPGADRAALLARIVATRRQFDIAAARAGADGAPPAADADAPGRLLRAIADAWRGWHPALAALPLICVIDEAEQLAASQLGALAGLVGAATCNARSHGTGVENAPAGLAFRIAGRRELAAEPALADWPRLHWDDLLRRHPHWPVLAQALLDRRLAPGELPPLADADATHPAVGLDRLIGVTAGNPALLLALFDRLALLVYQRGFRFGVAGEDSAIDAPLPAALQAEALAATAQAWFEPLPAPRAAAVDPRDRDPRRPPPAAAREAMRRLMRLLATVAGPDGAPQMLHLHTAGLGATAAATVIAALDVGWLLTLTQTGGDAETPTCSPGGVASAAPAVAEFAGDNAEAGKSAEPRLFVNDIARRLPLRLRVAPHPLLALRFQLGVSGRSRLALDAALLDAVFGANSPEQFARIVSGLAAQHNAANDTLADMGRRNAGDQPGLF